MTVREYPPLVLVPPEQTPPDNVLMSGIPMDALSPRPPFSDLFPTDNFGSRYQDVLERAREHIATPSDSPFQIIIKGIESYRCGFYDQEEENGWVRTEETRRGLALTLLQSHLAHSIDYDYHDLLAAGLSPDETMSRVGEYVLEQEERVADTYSEQLDSLTIRLAGLDRHDAPPPPTEIDGIPVLSARDMLLAMGETPPSEEVEHETRKDFLEGIIRTLRRRIERVKFERLSAVAILELSKQPAG